MLERLHDYSPFDDDVPRPEHGSRPLDAGYREWFEWAIKELRGDAIAARIAAIAGLDAEERGISAAEAREVALRAGRDALLQPF